MKELNVVDNVIPLLARLEFSDDDREDAHEIARAALKLSLQREGMMRLLIYKRKYGII